ERGLTHDFRKIIATEKKRSREEKELLHRTRVLAKLQTAADYEAFMEGLYREQSLRQRIAELQEYRRMGLTSLKEAQDYDRDKQQRQSSHTPIAGPSTSTPSGGPSFTVPNSSGGVSAGRAGRDGDDSTPSRRAAAPLPQSAAPTSSFSSSSAQLDVTTAEGVELLLPNERELCANLRIQPRAYLHIKEVLLREYAAAGVLQKKRARELIKIDVNKTAQIYDLFVVNGWISFAK
ncbi:Transcriptional adapter ada2, partial [Cladochytrium tenue]